MGMRARVLAVVVTAWFCSDATGWAAGVQVRSDAASEGTFGLRLTLGPDCASEHDLTLDGDDGPLQGSYQACRTIRVESVVVEGPSTTLTAGDKLSFDDGFSVAAGGGLVAVLDASLNGGPTYVEDRTPIDETIYTARFSARFDDLALAGGEELGNLVAYSGTGQTVFRVVVEPASGGGYQLALEARLDGGGLLQTPPGDELAIPAGWSTVELEWHASDGDGALLVGINGGSLAGLADLANGATRIETIRWGGVDGALFTGSGHLELDSFSSTR